MLLGLTTPSLQTLAAERVLKGGLNVRQTEELVARLEARSTTEITDRARGAGFAPIQDVHVASLETKLRERFGTKIHMRYRQGKGAIDIRFFSDDELERLLHLLGIPAE